MSFEAIKNQYKEMGNILAERLDGEQNYHGLRPKLANRIENQNMVHRDFLNGIFDELTPTGILERVYDNMMEIGIRNWNYEAGSNNNADTVASGSQTTVMCQTVCETFKYICNTFLKGEVFKDVPYIKNGMRFGMTSDLGNSHLLSYSGLPLLGKKRGYNVHYEIDAKTKKFKRCKRYFFNGHWQLLINGRKRDPLFKMDPTTIIDGVFEKTQRSDNLHIYELDSDKNTVIILDYFAGKVPTGEFGGQYLMVTNFDHFEAGLTDSSEDFSGVGEILSEIEKEVNVLSNDEKENQKNENWSQKNLNIVNGWMDKLNKITEVINNSIPDRDKDGPVEFLSYLFNNQKIEGTFIYRLKQILGSVEAILHDPNDTALRGRMYKYILQDINKIRNFGYKL